MHLKSILKKVHKMDKKQELDEKRSTQLEKQVADQEIEMKAAKDDVRQIRAEADAQFRWMPALLGYFDDENSFKRNFWN
jgi:septal ring factor EnvC (AmiA/AmiB activator)